MFSIIAEYIWIDGSSTRQSETKDHDLFLKHNDKRLIGL